MSASMGPPTSIINQSASGRFAVSGSDRSIRVKGTEFIRVLTLPTGFESGTVIYSTPNVAGPMNTRLANFAAIFERWRPYKYNYRYVPSVATTVAGSIVLASDPDVAADYPDTNTSNIPRLTSLTGHRMTALWQPAVCGIASSSDYTSLWTTDVTAGVTSTVDDRFDAAGQFVLCLVTPPGSNFEPGSAIGSLELEYDIEFFRPRLALSEGAGEQSEFILKVPPETFPQASMDTSMLAGARTFTSLKNGALTVALGGLAALLAGRANTRYEVQEIKRELRSPPPPVTKGTGSSSSSASKSSVSSSSTSFGKSVSVGTVCRNPQPLRGRPNDFDSLMDSQGLKPGVYDMEVWSGLTTPASDTASEVLLAQSILSDSDAPSTESVHYLSGTDGKDNKGDYANARNARMELSFFANEIDTNNRLRMPSGERVRIAAMRKLTFTVQPNREFASFDLPLYWEASYEDLATWGAVCNIVIRTRVATNIVDFTSLSTVTRPRYDDRKKPLPLVPASFKGHKPLCCLRCSEPMGFDSDTLSTFCSWCEAKGATPSTSSTSSRPFRVDQK
jgi:hypothetical protein